MRREQWLEAPGLLDTSNGTENAAAPSIERAKYVSPTSPATGSTPIFSSHTT
jgi:hypothetical protein